MRAHGVPQWPDPNARGQFVLTDVPGIGHHGAASSPQIQAAEQACRSLNPAGTVTSQQRQQVLDKALAFAACMRSHGEPAYPDPTVGSDGSITVSIKGSLLHSLQSPQFQAAERACKSLEPQGQPVPGS